MADKKNSAAIPSTPAAPALSPAEEVKLRIKTLEENIQSLQRQIKILNGRLIALDPQAAKQIESENKIFESRIQKLEIILFALITENQSSKDPADAKLKFEVFRAAALDYFKKANVDPETWKNLAS